MASTVNWDEVRLAYVTGTVSIPQVADQFGVTPSQAYKHSAAEGWVPERERFRRESAGKAKEKTQQEAAEASALIFKIAHFILSRYFDAIQQEGVVFDISDRNWAAKVLLELEEAGKGRTMIIEKADLSQLSDEQLDALVAHAGSTR